MHAVAPDPPLESTPRRVLFFDAEGTLWQPRPGLTNDHFWDAPSVERAREVFEPTPAIRGVLARLKQAGHRLVVLSRHDERLLPGLLAAFGLDVFFEAVLVNGDKGERALEWLTAQGLASHNALMVGDREDLDVAPLVRVGIPALLLHRPYNAHVPAPRLHDVRDLLAVLRLPDGERGRPARPAHA